MKKIVLFIHILFAIQSQAQYKRMQEKNLQVFSNRSVEVSPEAIKFNPNHKLHPDLGLLPFVSPPEKNCVELLEKRNAYSRYFVDANGDGSHFFIQQAYSPINYKDRYGQWREINYRLSPDRTVSGLFSANQQPTPIYLNLNNRLSGIEFEGKILNFNKNLMLVHVDENGIQSSLGEPDWRNYTAGDDGVRIIDFYPGIDVIFTFSVGTMETSFILKSRPTFTDGYLLMVQDLDLPTGMNFLSSASGQKAVHTEFHIGGADNVPVFTIEKCYAYDNGINPVRKNLLSRVENEKRFLVYTEMNWLKDPSTVYPVLIDPVVTTQNSIAAGAITGTQFSATCWTNSCDYFLTVPTPANTKITNIYTSFEYFATGACFAQDGGFSIDFASCTYPTAAPGVITCPFAMSNFNCGVLNSTTLPDFTSCIPAPQCASQNLDFTLHFYRCNNDPSAVCGTACIRASQPWMMTIEGRTMELIYNSPLQIVCSGDSVDVVTITEFGVEPYQYTWIPISPNNDTLRVSPTTTTDYTVTVTDACGTTGSGSSTVQVTPFNNPGFTISPNPACVGQAITMQGLGSGPLSSYDWTVPGSDAVGGVITNSKNPIIQYAVPGVYQATLRYTSNSCVFDSVLNIVIDAASAASVGMSSFPAGAICPGDSMRFTASPVNGGSAPGYDWYIDGILVQSGLSDSMKSNAFINGSLVQVVMTSNSQCSNPLQDTASLFVVFSNAVTPAVLVSPDTVICPGAAVTFNASPQNGGANPTYQWTINGIPVPGATGNSFTTNVSSSDSIVGVNMVSALSCVNTPNVSDSVKVEFDIPVNPVVTLSALPAGAVCAGDPVTFTARTNGGGAAPLYQWYMNGVPSGVLTADSTFTVLNPVQGDSVSVRLTSNHTCLLSANATSWSIMSVTAAASPTVSISALPSLSVCENDTISFTASANAAGNSPLYHWFINNVLQPISDSVFSVHSLNDQDIVRVEVLSSLSCAIVPSDTDSVLVNVSPISNPSVLIVNTANGTCIGDTIQWIANATNAGTGPTYQWTVNGLAQGTNSDTFSFMPQDGDLIQVSLTSNSQCALTPTALSNVFTVNLQAYVTPVVSIHASPSDTICPGANISITSTIQNGGSSPTYTWTVNSIPFSSNTSISGNTFSQGDIIQLSLRSNATCVTTSDTISNIIRILNYQPLDVQVNGSGNACPGVPVLLTAHANGGDGGPYTYIWNHTLEQSDSVTIYPSVTKYYSVKILDNCATTFATDSLLVPVLIGPSSIMTYSPSEVSTFNNLVQFQNLSQNVVSWIWDFGDSTFSADYDPVHIFDTAGTYQIMLVTNSANGCTDTLRYRIIVREDIAMFFPSAFTPNGDFQNETWQPIGASLLDYEYYIFDRWGQLIFTGDEDLAWDGHVINSHTPAQNGIYLFKVDLKDDRFEKREVVGRVTLIR